MHGLGDQLRRIGFFEQLGGELCDSGFLVDHIVEGQAQGGFGPHARVDGLHRYA
jgi:hypothetical protein